MSLLTTLQPKVFHKKYLIRNEQLKKKKGFSNNPDTVVHMAHSSDPR